MSERHWVAHKEAWFMKAFPSAFPAIAYHSLQFVDRREKKFSGFLQATFSSGFNKGSLNAS